MLRNKVMLKKYLFKTGMLLLVLSCFFSLLLFYERETYRRIYNENVARIFYQVKEKYPDITKDEIISIINQPSQNYENLNDYGIFLKEDFLLPSQEDKSKDFFSWNMIYLLGSFFLIILLFLSYNRKKDKAIAEITHYIAELNKRNYTLSLDDLSEDELSILKQEIYKTTVMLKESAENSLKDKKNLKKSLEDISHQIKTPITSILVTLDNLIDEPNMEHEVREKFIHDIKREVANINFLIQSLLKLSKFDANTITFLREEVSVQTLLEETINNVSSLCDLKNIKIEWKHNQKGTICCDRHWQVEALTNILKNGIDHSKENSKIVISYEENAVYSMIQIQDFGEGIAKKDLPHIFERFYKGENANSDSVGIGLALAKTIIEEDKGTIKVDSNALGTTFTIHYFH